MTARDDSRPPKSPKSSAAYSSSPESVTTVKEGGASGKSTRLAVKSLPSKRRSTMNSRDAAYEEEQLRLAIEASKEDLHEPSPIEGPRRQKRSRSESQE